MAFGITQSDVLDPNLLNAKFEELDQRFNRLPAGTPAQLTDQIRENLFSWGDFYWNHPTGYSDPRSGPDEPAYKVKSWCKQGEAGCTAGTKWNQVYRQTIALLDQAEAQTAGQAQLQPSQAGKVIQQEQVDIRAQKPLWWLLVPVVFLLGGALMIKPRRLREKGRTLPVPVPVEGVDGEDPEDCGCDGGGDDVLEGFPLEHLDRGAHAINSLKEQVDLLKKDIRGQTCDTTFSDLQWAETFRAIANTHLRAVSDDPTASEEERAHADNERVRLEKIEDAYKKLEEKFRNACLMG